DGPGAGRGCRRDPTSVSDRGRAVGGHPTWKRACISVRHRDAPRADRLPCAAAGTARRGHGPARRFHGAGRSARTPTERAPARRSHPGNAQRGAFDRVHPVRDRGSLDAGNRRARRDPRGHGGVASPARARGIPRRARTHRAALEKGRAMTEPKRWADEDATPLERSLLEAMRAERPGPRLSRRMRRAIGLGGTLVAVKLLGSGLAAAAIVASGIAITSMMENDAPAPPPAAPGSARIVERVAPPAPPPSAAEAHEESAPPSPSAAPRPVPQDAGQRAAAPRPSPPPAKIDAESALREEIRLLDGARAALRRGAPKQAREELDRYAARFP